MSSPYAGLLAGAGAAQGFEQLLARRLEGAKFEELKRQAQAKEAIAQQAAVLQEREFGATEAFRNKQLASGEELKQISLRHAQQVSDEARQDRLRTQTWREGEAAANRDWRTEESRLNRENQVSLRDMANAGRADARKPRIQVVQNAEGGMQRVNVDTGEIMPLVGPTGQPLRPEAASERLIQQHRDQILPTVKRLKELSTQIQTSSGPRQMLSGVKQYVGAKTNMNPVADEYMRLRGATALALSAIANQGRPTEPDRQALEAILPGLGTRKDVADNLWKSVERVLANPRKFGNISSITSELQGGTGDQPAGGSFKVGDFTFQPK